MPTLDIASNRRSHLPPKGTAGYRAEGKTIIVRTVAAGWEVRFGGFAGIDADLEGRRRSLALSGGQGRERLQRRHKRSGSRSDYPSPRNDSHGCAGTSPQPAPWAVMGRHAAQRRRVLGGLGAEIAATITSPSEANDKRLAAVRAHSRHAGAVRGIATNWPGYTLLGCWTLRPILQSLSCFRDEQVRTMTRLWGFLSMVLPHGNTLGSVAVRHSFR